MASLVTLIESKRSAYLRLPFALRTIIIVLAAVLGVVGVILLITPLLFDIGVLCILLSLGMLSFQFEWAYNLFILVTGKLADKKFRRKLFLTMGSIAAVILLAVAYWFWVRK